jgi:uncharacterized protein with von Willebrand factor type A (vWA) domain
LLKLSNCGWVRATIWSVDTYGLDWFVMAGHGGSGNRNCTLVDDAQTATASGYTFVEGQGPGTFWAASVGKDAIKGDLIGTDPDLAGRMRALLLPRVNTNTPPPVKENRRLGDALFPSSRDAPAKAPPPAEIELEATLTASAQERLQKADFETMSNDEFREALGLLTRLKPAFPPLPTRRREASPRPGRLDVRATLRAAGRVGGDFLPLRHSAPRTVVPPLVVLADVSGSMARYSRMLLHFAHLLGQAGAVTPSLLRFPDARATMARDAVATVAAGDRRPGASPVSVPGAGAARAREVV